MIDNLPGLSAIAYRAGLHSSFRESMLAALARNKTLGGLTTRDSDDFSMALLDAWAVVADVLTFYQERIANESYLRTATERLSVQQMARLIGYQLSPGVAAGTHLAFTIDEPPKLPQVAVDSKVKKAYARMVGKMDVFALGDATVGRGEFEPGWRWSQHAKPIAGTPSCQATHTGCVLEGRMRVQMDDGTETDYGPGDFFLMPAGHDAWIVGDQRCVIVDFTGVAKYAKKS